MSTNFITEALRAIGQDLDLRGLKTFSILCDHDRFAVDAGYQRPPAAMPVTIHYCRKDIEELNRKSAESSDYLAATRRLIYLSQILAAVGSYVEDKAGRLLSIANTASGDSTCVIDIQYETMQARAVSERLMDADVYALCIREHKRNQRRQVWNDIRFHRFSSLIEADATTKH
jgi:hypothetical protein